MLNPFRQRPAFAAGQALYRAAADKARDPAFYRDAHAPDTVEGRFELYMVHVILVAMRLRGQGKAAAETSQVMFDAFLRGLDDAMREMGVGDLSVGKKMRKLGEAFYGRAKRYDMLIDDPAELTALLRRTLYADLQDEGADADAAAMADYARRAHADLAAQPLDRLLAGEAQFPPLAPTSAP